MGGPSGEWVFVGPVPSQGGVRSCLWTHCTPSPSPLQGASRPTRSLSTAQLLQPSGGLQASVISSVVLMKGQAKVSGGVASGNLWNDTWS